MTSSTTEILRDGEMGVQFRPQDERKSDFLENYSMIKIAPLDPRDAFFGGHTGNIVIRYYGYGENTLRGRVLFISVYTENGCISDRTSYLYRLGLY